MRHVTLRLALSTLALSSLLSACGGKQEEANSAPAYEIDNSDEDPDDGMEMMQEFGGMNQEKVDRTVERLQPELADCLMHGYERVDFMSGDIAFLVKVNLAGRADAALAERSTLGDLQTEQCMLDKLKASRWPKPVGGRIGLARTSMGFDGPDDVRAPVPWSPEEIDDVLDANASALDECGSGGPFDITMYVDTDGTVMSAGVAHSDENGESTASCLIDAVTGLTFSSPGSWPAKVSFSR